MDTDRIKREIADFISPVVRDDDAARLLGLSIGRLLLREGERWRTAAISRWRDIRHVGDWLSSAVTDNAAWLGRVDEMGRPLKLMKLGSIEAAVHEADKAMRIAIQKAGKVALDGTEETLHTALADGFFVARLRSPAALDRESAAMQHCIGNGGYDGDLSGEDYLLLSLRDAANRPHATFRVDAERSMITEFQGKQNRRPAERYMPYVRQFIRLSGLGLSGDDQAWAGMVQDRNGDWHPLENLPDDLETAGDLHLLAAPPFRMPSRLVVNGDFTAPVWMREHPAVLHVSGHYVHAELPPIKGDFKAGSMNLSAADFAGDILPERLDVTCLVIDAGDRRILPDRFEVTGGLTLKLSSSRQVPKVLKVGRALDITGCGVRKWDGDIECGDLNVRDVRRLSIGGRLVIRGDLDAEGSEIVWPEAVRIGGDATFSRASGYGCFTKPDLVLPRAMKVGGDLIMEESRIREMPSILEVGGDLGITDAEVTSLGGLRKVGGALRMEGTQVRELPAGLTRVGHLMAAMSSLERLPDGFTTTDQLILIGTPMTGLPAGLRVGGDLFLQNSGIESLPDDASVGGRIHGIRLPGHEARVRADRRQGRSLRR